MNFKTLEVEFILNAIFSNCPQKEFLASEAKTLFTTLTHMHACTHTHTQTELRKNEIDLYSVLSQCIFTVVGEVYHFPTTVNFFSHMKPTTYSNNKKSISIH